MRSIHCATAPSERCRGSAPALAQSLTANRMQAIAAALPTTADHAEGRA